MRKKFLKNAINAIKKKYPNYDDEKLEVIEYGLESFTLWLLKLSLFL